MHTKPKVFLFVCLETHASIRANKESRVSVWASRHIQTERKKKKERYFCLTSFEMIACSK